MKDYLISLYLDDELTLSDKQEFIDLIAADRNFLKEASELLAQEETLRDGMVNIPPPDPVIPLRKRIIFEVPSFSQAFAGLIVASLLLTIVFRMQPPPVTSGPALTDVPHRFVLYLPEVQEAAVVGNFSDWSPLPMQKIGSSGYWALDLELEPGEYRYSYLVENVNRMVDPTIQARESDDFGGQNSIITVGISI